MRTAHHQTLTSARQRGAALLVILVLLITGGAYLLVSQLNRVSGRIDAEKKTAAALAQAKEALIGWAVGNLTTPGMLPYPDRRDDGQYDGLSDCPAAGVATSAILLLGKIPQVGSANPCVVPWTALGLDVVDGAGEVLWYAVSRNLVSSFGVAPVINPGIINSPTFPWLVVRDPLGNIINDRVAFVLIAPGPALPGQNRTVPPTPGLPPSAAQFLEGILAVSNADFDGAYDTGAPCLPATPPTPMCEDFVMSEPWPSTTAPTFNDRLLYVTIGELMPLIEQRVAREVRQALNRSAATNGGMFPTAAALGYLGNSCGNPDGFLPLSPCQCTSDGTDVTCNCHFDAAAAPLASITYSYTGLGNYTAALGCTLTGPRSCRCTGAGNCSLSAGPIRRTFQCNANGACIARNSVLTSNFNVSYSLPSSIPGNFTGVNETTVPPNCTPSPPLTSRTMSCGSFTQIQAIVGGCAQVLNGLPDWFFTNGWKQFMYYAFSNGPPPPLLTVGAIANVRAVVISTGAPLGTQTRPPFILGSYLDDFENSNGPPAFTGVGQRLTNNFNDQAVIVSP